MTKKRTGAARRKAPAASMSSIRDMVAKAAAEFVMAGGNSGVASLMARSALADLDVRPEPRAQMTVAGAIEKTAFPPQPMTQRPASAVLGAHVEATHSLASRVCHIVGRLVGPIPETAGGKAVAQAAGLIPDAIDQADYAMDAIRRAHLELDRLEAAI